MATPPRRARMLAVGGSGSSFPSPPRAGRAPHLGHSLGVTPPQTQGSHWPPPPEFGASAALSPLAPVARDVPRPYQKRDDFGSKMSHLEQKYEALLSGGRTKAGLLGSSSPPPAHEAFTPSSASALPFFDEPPLPQFATRLAANCEFTFDDCGAGPSLLSASSPEPRHSHHCFGPARSGFLPSPVPYHHEAWQESCEMLSTAPASMLAAAANLPNQLGSQERSRSASVASDRSRAGAVAEGRATAAETAETDARRQLLDVEGQLAASQAACTQLQQRVEEFQTALVAVQSELGDLSGGRGGAPPMLDASSSGAVMVVLTTAAVQLRELRFENSRLERISKDAEESSAQNARLAQATEGALLVRTQEVEALRGELEAARAVGGAMTGVAPTMAVRVPAAVRTPGCEESSTETVQNSPVHQFLQESEESPVHQHSSRLPPAPSLASHSASPAASLFNAAGLPPALPSDSQRPRSLSPPCGVWCSTGDARGGNGGVVTRLMPRPTAAVPPTTEVVSARPMMRKPESMDSQPSSRPPMPQQKAAPLALHELPSPCRGARVVHKRQNTSQSPAPMHSSASPFRLRPTNITALPATGTALTTTMTPQMIRQHPSSTLVSEAAPLQMVRRPSPAALTCDRSLPPSMQQQSLLRSGSAASIGAGATP